VKKQGPRRQGRVSSQLVSRREKEGIRGEKGRVRKFIFYHRYTPKGSLNAAKSAAVYFTERSIPQRGDGGKIKMALCNNEVRDEVMTSESMGQEE